uniref:Uncharacterized protein n=1 Tax=Zea mays TaxID=4577 RepID=B7ZZG8_MAIZE|nr:unknown [Zea mays]
MDHPLGPPLHLAYSLSFLP